MAEFLANNNYFLLTRLFPFFTSKGLHLYMSFDIIDFSDTTIREQINIKKAINISEVMQSI